MATRLRACLWVSISALLVSELFAQMPVRKIRQKMTDTINNTPDFMCAVSIERTERNGKAAPVSLAPLRLEAGIVNGKEVYSMPQTDDGRENLKRVLEIYRRAGTGSFAMYSRAVFTTGDATFYDGPEETQDGRTLSRLDFAMPREVSHYALNVAEQPLELGYSGSIWIDPKDLDVAQVKLEADAIPKDTGIKAITQIIKYARGGIRGFSHLLPVSSDLVLDEAAGRELRVMEHFSDCHAHALKSGEQLVENELKVKAAPAPAPPVTAKPAVGAAPAVAAATRALPSAEELMPAGTLFEMILKDPIDERTTAINSKLGFEAMQDIKVRGKVLVAKGATASAHITRILRQTYVEGGAERTYYAVGIQMDSLQVGERHYQLWANLERVGPPATQICFVPYSHDPGKWGDFEVIYTLFLIPKPEYGESFLGVVYEFLRLGSNWRTYWTVMQTPP